MTGSPRIRLLATVLCVLAAVAVLLAVLLGFAAPARGVPLPDYNEPNDNFAAATQLVNGTTQHGAITTATDEDYFYLDLAGSRTVVVDFTTGGYRRACKLCFMASGGDTIVDLGWARQYDDDGSFHAQGTLGPGRFFAVVSVGGTPANTSQFTLTVTATGGSTTFPDVPAGSPFADAINELARDGVISGFANGTFGPNQPVTRQQFAKMIVRAAGFPVSPADACPFLDVMTSTPGHYLDANDPLYPDHYVAVASAHGITVGITPTIFHPDHNITLAQVVTMVVRTAENQGVWDSPPSAYEPPFDDFGPPHYSYARTGAAHGLFNGYTGPYAWFAPPATRGQCAFFIWKLTQALDGSGGGEPEPIY
jgi:hypothetical protein